MKGLRRAPSQAIRDHPDWVDGDFTLVSSDGWQFCVPSEVLFAASQVLADAPATGVQRFQFPDAVIERKAVLEQFLCLAKRGTLDKSKVALVDGKYDDRAIRDLADLISFLHKYDCETVTARLQEVLVQMMPGHLWGWQVYSLGALMGDDNLCAASLRVEAVRGSHDPKVHVKKSVTFHNDAGISARIAACVQMQPRYQYALGRVERASSVLRSTCSPDVIYNIFNQALREYDAPLKAHPSWRVGDVVVISSDNWLFKIPSRILRRAGFHTGHAAKSGKGTGAPEEDSAAGWPDVLRFIDLAVETKAVFEQFLALAATGRLHTPSGSPRWHDCPRLSGYTLNIYLETLAFMQKYSCQQAIAEFGAQIVLLMAYGVVAPNIGFSFGALAQDKDVCAASLAFYSPAQGRFLGRDALPDFVVAHVSQQANATFLDALQFVKDYTDRRYDAHGPSKAHRDGGSHHFRDDDLEDSVSDDSEDPEDGYSFDRWKTRYREPNLAKRFLAYMYHVEVAKY